MIRNIFNVSHLLSTIFLYISLFEIYSILPFINHFLYIYLIAHNMSGFNDIMVIFCFVLGDSIDDRFTINISRTKGKMIGHEKISFEILNFLHFKKLICDSGYTFKENKLKLWKVSISTKPEDKDDKLIKLQKLAQDVQINAHAEINIKKQLGGVPLNPDDYIKDIFVEDPPEKHIHIIIEKPGKILIWYKYCFIRKVMAGNTYL
jgi:hypothetical protein